MQPRSSAGRLGQHVVFGDARVAVEDVLRRALHEAVGGGEEPLPDDERLVELGGVARACCRASTSLRPLGAEAVDPHALWPHHQVEERLALEVGGQRRPKRRKLGPHDFSSTFDDHAGLLAHGGELVVDALEVAAAVEAREVGLERLQLERLVGLRLHLLFEHLRIGVVRAFDA